MFLSSRYGIKVDQEKVMSTILHGLGGDSSADDDCLDLMELVAMLLIPIFLKAADTDTMELTEEQFLAWGKGTAVDVDALMELSTKNDSTEGLEPVPKGMLDYVLKMILHDVRIHLWRWPWALGQLGIVYSSTEFFSVSIVIFNAKFAFR
jgi:hypothetical protein